MHRENEGVVRAGRRAFLKNGVLVLTAANLDLSSVFAEPQGGRPAVTVGLVTDLHYADKPPAGSRHYRETPGKLAEAAAHFGKQVPDFVVELGDLVDAADTVEAELGYLKRINRDFAAICENRHYVLGNHCVFTLTKPEFLAEVGQAASYYAFDSGGFHFVVLDSCFRSDGEPYGRNNFDWADPNIPAAEVAWLAADLQATHKKTIVFAHQRLDVPGPYGVKNAAEVRQVLEASGHVLAVFQGHSHENAYQEISGIHYCTLVAMIEGSGVDNNGYSVLRLADDATIRVEGFRNQNNYMWQT